MTTNSGERTLRDRVGEQVYLNWRARMNPASETTWTELSPEDREWHRADADALLAAGVTAAESVPVADRERAVEVGAQAIHRWDKRPVTWERLDADTLEQYRSEAAVVVDALLAAGVFRSEPEIQDPVAGRDYMWDSSPVPAQDADDDEEYCPKCFAGMTAANHDECTDVRLVAARARVTAVLRAQRVMVTDEWHLTETSAGRVADALAAAGVFSQPKVSDTSAEGVRSEAVALDPGVVAVTIRSHTLYPADAVETKATCSCGWQPDDRTRFCLSQHAQHVRDHVMKLARPEAVVKAEALREAAASLPLQGLVGETARIILRERADEMEGK